MQTALVFIHPFPQSFIGSFELHTWVFPSALVSQYWSLRKPLCCKPSTTRPTDVQPTCTNSDTQATHSYLRFAPNQRSTPNFRLSTKTTSSALLRGSAPTSRSGRGRTRRRSEAAATRAPANCSTRGTRKWSATFGARWRFCWLIFSLSSRCWPEIHAHRDKHCSSIQLW